MSNIQNYKSVEFCWSCEPMNLPGSRCSSLSPKGEREPTELVAGLLAHSQSFLSQPEYIQHHCVALVLEFRRVEHFRLGRSARSRGNRHILFAVHLECHRRRGKSRADVDLPQLVERRVVVSRDGAIKERHKNHAAGG